MTTFMPTDVIHLAAGWHCTAQTPGPWRGAAGLESPPEWRFQGSVLAPYQAAAHAPAQQRPARCGHRTTGGQDGLGIRIGARIGLFG